ncbi:MAG TPA: hypothetical protein VLZ10_06795 [Thermodesulfobacteriota bacterium]|jgi:hypothetical protein|nr:hypothetical protein [Thermodesulfobacteriota bacterium]
MTEMVESLSHALRKLGSLNLLAIGIAVIVLWLLVSGLKKGLKKDGRDKDSEENDHGE